MSNWRSIASAPKDMTILVYIPDAADGLCIEIAHSASDDPDGDWYRSNTCGAPFDVPPSHWMPMPDAPEADNPGGQK